MDKIYEKTLLFDFYGELLTKHRQEIYEEVVFNDMTLSEAAAVYGMTRQAVHDLISRCDSSMEGYEEKLHMIRRYESIKKKVNELLKTAGETETGLLREILEDLDS